MKITQFERTKIELEWIKYESSKFSHNFFCIINQFPYFLIKRGVVLLLPGTYM
jgi:hypothetical protein